MATERSVRLAFTDRWPLRETLSSSAAQASRKAQLWVLGLAGRPPGPYVPPNSTREDSLRLRREHCAAITLRRARDFAVSTLIRSVSAISFNRSQFDRFTSPDM